MKYETKMDKDGLGYPLKYSLDGFGFISYVVLKIILIHRL
jgi:hypothetical protein